MANLSTKDSNIAPSASILDSYPYRSEFKSLYDEYPHLNVPGYWNVLDENLQLWAQQIKNSHAWSGVSKAIQNESYVYLMTNQSKLLDGIDIQGIDFLSKPVPSIVEKLKRQYWNNETKTFSSQAFVANINGFPIPNLDDLIRTRIPVTYLDGVNYFGDIVKKVIPNATQELKGKIEGYYANHIYFDEQVFLKYQGNTTLLNLSCEIQIATQSATRLWNLSHQLYTQDRGEPKKDMSWQWNHKNPRFLCNQLGHALHLTEGLFVQLRDEINTKGN